MKVSRDVQDFRMISIQDQSWMLMFKLDYVHDIAASSESLVSCYFHWLYASLSNQIFFWWCGFFFPNVDILLQTVLWTSFSFKEEHNKRARKYLFLICKRGVMNVIPALCGYHPMPHSVIFVLIILHIYYISNSDGDYYYSSDSSLLHHHHLCLVGLVVLSLSQKKIDIKIAKSIYHPKVRDIAIFNFFIHFSSETFPYILPKFLNVTWSGLTWINVVFYFHYYSYLLSFATSRKLDHNLYSRD